MSGGLSDAERSTVTSHLAGCAGCRRELEEIVLLRRGVRHALSTEDGPGPTARSTTLRRIAAGTADRAARRYSVPRWLAAAASVVLIAQAGLLVWNTRLQPPAVEIRTRSVPAAAVFLDLQFQPSASHAGVIDALRSMNARVVAGPGPDGEFRVEVVGLNAEALARLLESGGAHPAIERVTLVQPDAP